MRGLWEFRRSYTPVFSLKDVLGFFRKSQQNSALSDLFSGNSERKGPLGVDSTPPPGKVGLILVEKTCVVCPRYLKCVY